MRRNLVLGLAAGLPLALYLWTLSGGSYWLDGGEFVAAAINLDIAHPPGHPLTAIYGKAWSLVPLGPLSFRIALGQAVAAALSVLLLFRACEATARVCGLRAPSTIVPIALLGAWLSGLGYAVWFQAIRPEVYALQGVLTFLSMERMAQLQLDPERDPRLLYAAAFAIGLGLTNHHVMSFFMFPALLFSAWTVTKRRGVRPWLVCASLGALSLLVYAYLPLRAARHPPANLGDPTTFERIYWVVSARVYARGMGESGAQPLAERYGDTGVVLEQDMLGVFLLVALLGIYVLLRRRTSLRMGMMWLLVAVPVLGVRPWLGSVRGNPDAIGYMTAGFAAVAVFATAGVAVLASFANGNRRWEQGIVLPLWLLAAGVLVLQVGRGVAQADLSSFHGPDLFDEYRDRALPPRSVLVATTPQTVFRRWELDATEGLRRDIALVPLPFLRYPGVADAVVRSNPDLREIVDRFLASNVLSSTALEHLAARRPVMTELDSHVPPSTYATLLPAGLLYATVGARAARGMLVPAATLQRAVYRRIYADLGRDLHETETAHQLLWLHYMDALYYAARGDRQRAAESLAAATRLGPQDVQLGALRKALRDPTRSGPLDVRPFLAFDAAPTVP